MPHLGGSCTPPKGYLIGGSGGSGGGGGSAGGGGSGGIGGSGGMFTGGGGGSFGTGSGGIASAGGVAPGVADCVALGSAAGSDPERPPLGRAG